MSWWLPQEKMAGKSAWRANKEASSVVYGYFTPRFQFLYTVLLLTECGRRANAKRPLYSMPLPITVLQFGQRRVFVSFGVFLSPKEIILLA
jgi:hypothetical protein